MKEKDGFFSKKHLINAGWAVIIAAAGFVGGLFAGWLRGPETINITSASNKQPVVVRIENVDNNGSKYDAYIDAIREEIRGLRESRFNAKGYKDIHKEMDQYNRVKIPPFKFPRKFDKYIYNSLSGFARTTSPSKEVTRGSIIIIEFDLLDKSIIDKATPLFVTLLKVKSKNSYLQDMQIQYEIREGKNKIRLAINSDPGSYLLEYGFYFLNDLSLNEINFYGQQYEIIII